MHRIDPRFWQQETVGKYIVGKTPSGIVLVAKPYPEFGYHADIRDWFERDASVRMRVLGGGLLETRPADACLRTFGTSGGFGDPPKDALETLLAEAFPDFTRHVEITREIW